MGISKDKKLLLARYVSFCCEQCKKKFPIEELQAHRIVRGGDYNNFRIIKILCKSCHKLIHYSEF